MLSDVCEVVYSDVVGEGFEVEFPSLGFCSSAGQVVSIASLQRAVDGFGFASLVVPFEEGFFVFNP